MEQREGGLYSFFNKYRPQFISVLLCDWRSYGAYEDRMVCCDNTSINVLIHPIACKNY